MNTFWGCLNPINSDILESIPKDALVLIDISQFLQFSFSGVTLGSIYALMAVSFSLVYRVSRVINFAQGEFFVFGALTMVTLTSKGVFIPLAFLLSVMIVASIGAILERALIRPISGSDIGKLITMTIGISLALQGLALLVWGRDSHVSQPFSGGDPLMILDASLQIQVIWIVGTTVAVLFIVWLFFEKTLVGLAMRACADNPVAASLMGISVGKISLFAWTWGAALGAIAGMVIAPLYFLEYTSGIMPMIKGFIALAIGGLTATFSAVIAGYFLGLLEAYTIGLASSEFSDVIVFAILILVLLARQRGILGKPEDGDL